MRAFLVTAAVLLLATPALAGGPRVSVSSNTVSPGGQVTVNGAAWPRNSRVSILLGPPGSEASKVGTLRTGSDGKFKGLVKFSRSAKPGRYVLLACRKKCAVKASTRITVVD